MTEIVNVSAASDTKPAKQPRKLSAYIVWAAVLVVLAVLGWGLINTNANRPSDVAPDFAMQFFDGYQWEGRADARLADMKGKVVVLNFWASWCVECRVEAELLEQTSREYADKGVVFLGIAYVDVEPRSLEYLDEFNITYPNAPDLRSAVSTNYKVTGVPETFFIGKDGKIAHIEIGPVSEELLIGKIEELLQAPG
jgi:cytochrome c biogenesis protein CcmG/thiol:disulfide interchange protein DsbE